MIKQEKLKKSLAKSSQKPYQLQATKKKKGGRIDSKRQRMASDLKNRKWIEISPYGIVGGMIPSASAVLFKGKQEEDRFVVWLSELKSQIAVEQNLNKEKIFDFAQRILSANNCLPKQCLFVRSIQGRSLVKLYFENSKEPMDFYADEVICFCMMNNCRFFCTEEFLKQSSREEIPKQFRKEVLSEKPLYLN